MKNSLMKSVQYILERRTKPDKRCYKNRHGRITRSTKNGEGRLTEYVRERRETA